MESGDHVDAHKFRSSEEASKHKHYAELVGVENLEKGEPIAPAGGHQTGSNMENFLFQSSVPDNKSVFAKGDVNEFILHESVSSVPRNEFNHAQEQEQKDRENQNANHEECSQNEESAQNDSVPNVNSNYQHDSLNEISKGQGDEKISNKEILEGKQDIVNNSVVSKENEKGDSSTPDNKVNDSGKINLPSSESQLSQEISVEAVEKASENQEKVPGKNAPSHFLGEVHPETKPEENSKKENDVASYTKTEVTSGNLIDTEITDPPAGNEEECIPDLDGDSEFISHESNVKNFDRHGIKDFESEYIDFMDTEKLLMGLQKNEEALKLKDLSKDDMHLKPDAIEKDSKLNTSREQPTSNEEEEWLDIVGSGQLMKKILQKAENEYRPQNSFICEINLEGRLEDGTVVEKYENKKIQVGDFEVVQGIDLALPLMNVGEVALIEVGPRFAYGSLGNLPEIPPDAKLTYKIELLSAENEPEMDSLSIEERRRIGDQKRERGNWWYSRKEYSFAIRNYRRALEFLDDAEEGFSVEKKELAEDTEKKFQELLEDRLKVYNNLAAAHIMNKSYDAALTSVENVLRCQPQNVKALRRKAKILAAKGDPAGALSILRNVNQLEPDSTSVKQEIQRLQDVIKRDTKQEKSLYKKMLGQTKTAEKSVPKTPKVSYRTWGIVCSSVAVVLLGAVAYRYKFL